MGACIRSNFFLGCGGLSYAGAQDVGKDTTSLVAFIISLFFTFLGLFFLGYTSKFIFNHTRGNSTIRSSIGPLIYRSRTFSKKELLTPKVSTETSEGITLWQVSLRISGRKKYLNIIVNNEKMANYLVDRIRAFKKSE